MLQNIRKDLSGHSPEPWPVERKKGEGYMEVLKRKGSLSPVKCGRTNSGGTSAETSPFRRASSAVFSDPKIFQSLQPTETFKRKSTIMANLRPSIFNKVTKDWC